MPPAALLFDWRDLGIDASGLGVSPRSPCYYFKDQTSGALFGSLLSTFITASGLSLASGLL